MSEQALTKIAAALRALGTGDAATTMGAIEALAMKQREGAADIADAIRELADAIRSHKE